MAPLIYAMATILLTLLGICGSEYVAGTKGTGVKPRISRIVNGNDADPCEWRWQVALTGRSLCGGSLIAPSWVITAAHCFEGPGGRNRFTHVNVGDYKLKTNGENKPFEKKIKIKRSIMHPNYNSPIGNAHDIALVELDEKVDVSQCVGFALLPSEPVKDETTCYITGWGTLSQGGSTSNTLQEAEVKIVPNSKCKRQYGGGISADMLCAQGKNNGKISDACQGDSGGPLVCKNDKGKFVLHGVTSFGRGCAQKSFPGVWSRVHKSLDFIEQYVRGREDCQDTDGGKTDRDGDGCSWYTENDPLGDEYCGHHDDRDFKAKKMCCRCGGGSTNLPKPTLPPSPPKCEDTDNGKKDKDGDGCDWYTEHDEHGEHCGHHDTNTFHAFEMCCRCEGGTTNGFKTTRLFEDRKPIIKEGLQNVQIVWVVAAAMAVVMGVVTAMVVAYRSMSRRQGVNPSFAIPDTELFLMED